MEFEINASNLFDSPYTKEMNSIFTFDDVVLADLANDICYGNPTCYLVSGYRGVGKSSFIKKLECKIDEKLLSEEKLSKKHVLFVYTSFAKYQSQSYLIRKLIRELFLKISSTEHYTNLTQDAPETKKLL